MKYFATNIISMLLFLMHANHTFAQAKDQLTVTLSKPGNPFILRFQLQQGTIEINSYPGNTIQVEAAPIPEKKRTRKK